MRHNLAFGRTKPLMIAAGLTPRSSYVDIDYSDQGDGYVNVKMGWSFSSTFPAAAVRNIERLPDRKVGSIGVHGWAGSWLVNGSLTGLVAFDIEPASTFRLAVARLRLSRLTLSLEDPDAFIANLEAAVAPAK